MLLGEKWSRTDLGHVLLHLFPTHNVYKKAVSRIIFLVQRDTDLIRRFQSIHSNHPSLACVNFFKKIKLEVLVTYFRFSDTIPAGCFPLCDGLTAISFERIQSENDKTWKIQIRNKRCSTSTQITNDSINHCACSKKACRAASWATFAHPQHPLETHYSRSSKNITLCAKQQWSISVPCSVSGWIRPSHARYRLSAASRGICWCRLLSSPLAPRTSLKHFFSNKNQHRGIQN